MKMFSVLVMLAQLFALTQGQTGPEQSSGLTVLKFNWSKYRQGWADTSSPFDRETSAGFPRGSGDKEKRMREAEQREQRRTFEMTDLERVARSMPPTRSGSHQSSEYVYSVKIRNDHRSPVVRVVWEYQGLGSTDRGEVSRRQFMCKVKIKPGESKNLKAFSAYPPMGVVSISDLATGVERPPVEKISLVRVEYANGNVWQRSGGAPVSTRLANVADMEPVLKGITCISL